MTSNSPPSLMSRRKAKRSSRACDRCRLRKIKCNGLVPCSACHNADLVCHLGGRRKLGNDHVDELKAQQAVLVEAILEMWKRYVQGDGPDRGKEPPSVHYIVKELGLLKNDRCKPTSGDCGLGGYLADLDVATSPTDGDTGPSQPVSPSQEDSPMTDMKEAQAHRYLSCQSSPDAGYGALNMAAASGQIGTSQLPTAAPFFWQNNANPFGTSAFPCLSDPYRFMRFDNWESGTYPSTDTANASAASLSPLSPLSTPHHSDAVTGHSAPIENGLSNFLQDFHFDPQASSYGAELGYPSTTSVQPTQPHNSGHGFAS